MISNSGTSTLGLYDLKRQIDAFGGVDYFRPNLVGGYLKNARVMLANGDIVKSTIDGNANNPNVDMIGWFLDSSDANIKTWSGRTQEEKNKETISPFDFGANGDGVTSDTQAFADLEVTYQGRDINLLGKTYLVDKPPIKNNYLNGRFKIADEVIPSIDTQARMLKQKPLIDSNTVNTNALRYSLIRTESTGGINSVPQGVAYDPVNERLYEVAAGGTDGRGHSLNIFQATTTGVLDDYYRNRSEFFGHQGVGLSYDQEDGNPIIWMSRNYNDTPNTGHQVTAFTGVNLVSEENSITANIKVFDVFEATGGSQSVTPTISSCGRYLVGKFLVGESARIRIFDAQRMWKNRATKLDYSKDYLHEFTVPKPTDVDLQGLACDGTYVYILEAQYGFNNNAWVYVATMQGDIVDKVNIANVGLQDAINDSPNPELQDGTKEYEGLLIFSDAGKHSLGIVLATTYNKTDGKKNCYIYEIGSSTTTAHLKGGAITTGRGLLHSASPRGTSYNFGVRNLLDSNCSYWTVNPERDGILTNKGNPVYWAGALTGGIQAVSKSSEGMSNIILARTDNGAEGSRLIFHKSRSASVDSKVNVSMGTARMGTIYFGGDTGSGSAEGATIVSGGTVSGVNIDAYVEVGVQNGLGAKQNYRFDKIAFTANGDNNKTLGKPESRWSTVYAGTGTINTSDERLKQQFRSLDELEKAAALEIKNSICLYKFNDAVDLKGDGARWHVGVKAQQVVSILESHGLNWQEYSFVCFDEWDEQEEVIGEDGVITQEYQEAGSRYAIRYDELSMFILSSI